jgi:NitT/TauT family transport system permease protein
MAVARRALPPLLVAVTVVALWEAGTFHRLLGLETYTLAYPSAIVRALADDWPSLLMHTRVTLTEAMAGYALGSLSGFVLAVPLCELPPVRRALLPLVSGLASMPVIALAPLMVLYFGFGVLSKIAVVVLMTLPPMAITAFKGLSSADRHLQDVLASFAAGRPDLLIKLRLPWSLPFVFTALKLNVTLSLIGAIIAEFFAARQGLGFRMSYALDTFDMPVAWATMLIAAVLGVVWYQVVVGVERMAIPWHVSIRSGSA